MSKIIFERGRLVEIANCRMAHRHLLRLILKSCAEPGAWWATCVLCGNDALIAESILAAPAVIEVMKTKLQRRLRNESC